MWLAWFVEAAFACSILPGVYAFDAWVDGATGVPTDARIVTLGYGVYELTLTRLDTGELLATTGEMILDSPLGDMRVAHTPEVELAVATTYRADVVGIDGGLLSATFTTGDGPSDPDLAAPVLGPLEAADWEPSDWFICTIGYPVDERTVTGTLTLPDALPVGSYIALSSGAGWFDYVGPASPGDSAITILQGLHASEPADQRLLRDCVTLTLVLPSGVELVSDEVCAETSPADAGAASPPSGCGCAPSIPVNLVGVVLVAGALARRRSGSLAQAMSPHRAQIHLPSPLQGVAHHD